MDSGPTHVLKFSKEQDYAKEFRTGVSLHSHTMHSREYLGRLPGYISRIPIANYIIEREVGRMHLYTGRCLNFKATYWTPPLSAREAFELEGGQISSKLGLKPLVSLSDHDNIEAGLHLRMLEQTADAPISVEWSVPFDRTVFHLGVHNLPAASANNWMVEFERFTAKPSNRRLRELLRDLNSEPSVLVILNHPYWDAENTGAVGHREILNNFLLKYGLLLHALELNGLRSQRENKQVLELARAVSLPVISGGDRHGCEPNATLNVTSATTFADFVDEIRRERRSNIMLMPQFFEPLRLRLLENTLDVLKDGPGEFGRGLWMTRIFFPGEDGSPRPLSDFAGTRVHRFVDKFRWAMGLLASPQLRPAIRLTFLGGEEGGL
jgi:hypothetical protein